ncbi:MAG TPA: hypothetical protein V6D10_16985 [Trichocoleus sp.]|jgi:hypothetical protein
MIKLRQFFTAIVATVLLFCGAAFVSSPAMAKALTPEAAAYQVAGNYSADSWGKLPTTSENKPNVDTRSQTNSKANSKSYIDLDNAQVDNAQNNLKSAADNVREKLNLDQPLYPGTKEFIGDVQESVGDAVEGVKDTLGGASDAITGGRS